MFGIFPSQLYRRGVPWNSPVWFARDKDYNLYFGSPKDTQHSKNIRANGKGFIVIYDSHASDDDAEGVYMTAVVKELTRLLDVLKAVKIMFKASPKVKTSDFLKLSKLRVYLIKPKKIWMNWK